MGTKRFAIKEHQDKSVPLIQALIDRGYTQATNHLDDVDFYLVDFDRNRNEMTECLERRVPVFVYPHSARSIVAYDGIYKPWPHVRCNFVFGEGQKEIATRIGYRVPTEVIGWPYERAKFEPTSGLRILFAPIHPNAGGIKLTQIDRDLNRQAFEVLRATALKFTVRYGRGLEDNGLYNVRDHFVTFSQAELSVGDSLSAIRNADLIIGHQMFAFLSIAMGKPTVMFGESTAPHNVRRSVRSWSKYRDLLKFPLDLLNPGEPVVEFLAHACESDSAISAWRSQFIGPEFDPDKFVDKIESFL